MSPADLLQLLFSGLFAAAGPLVVTVERNVWWIVPTLVLGAIVRAPMPGRGPASAERDPWRGFKNGLRRHVLERAQHRCEAARFLVRGRCTDAATEVDHVYAWSRGGPTTASNGQALCSGHNRSKGAWTVPWWYLRALERRRRSYFPEGSDVRVFATISDEERRARRARADRQRRAEVRPRAAAGRGRAGG